MTHFTEHILPYPSPGRPEGDTLHWAHSPLPIPRTTWRWHTSLSTFSLTQPQDDLKVTHFTKHILPYYPQDDLKVTHFTEHILPYPAPESPPGDTLHWAHSPLPSPGTTSRWHTSLSTFSLTHPQDDLKVTHFTEHILPYPSPGRPEGDTLHWAHSPLPSPRMTSRWHPSLSIFSLTQPQDDLKVTPFTEHILPYPAPGRPEGDTLHWAHSPLPIPRTTWRWHTSLSTFSLTHPQDDLKVTHFTKHILPYPAQEWPEGDTLH